VADGAEQCGRPAIAERCRAEETGSDGLKEAKWGDSAHAPSEEGSGDVQDATGEASREDGEEGSGLDDGTGLAGTALRGMWVGFN